MKIIRSWDEFNDAFSVSEYPDEYRLKDTDGVQEFNLEYRSEIFHHVTKCIFIDGVHIHFSNKSNKEDFGYFVRTDSPYLQMHFEFSGGGFYTAKAKGDMDCAIPAGHHTLFYFPALLGHLIYPSVTNGWGIEIELSYHYLNRIFNGNFGVLEGFMEQIDRERPTMLGGKSHPITSKMKQILMDIYHCSYVGALKRVFVEGKLMELLCLQIEQLTGTGSDANRHSHQPKKELMMEVKQLVEENINQPLSIEELSKKVGVNRTKLQQSFKETFGKTIFGHLTDLRMEAARELLICDPSMKISEIALKAGYKNPNHFSVAFRRKFGYLPSTMK
ncbi:AraC-like DNA-binding protein [Algoriphagus sp. 4150]|uniref:helix-turn-helix transcriptional regulator n=1 Tax=Algoriphagus sp. 4150 TaxID=2817756 RepID=UPI002862B11A|nr:AraC family transcriptional regulator [Algoriphagus sp. 4150]MDR7131450.1 AraC-like DNA-binding protein [Algoriphagus sp. 4150]